VNKHLLYAGAGVAAILLTAPANAQSGNPIDYCRQNSNGKSERIACLEAAITALMSQTTVAAAPPAPQDSEMAAAPAVPAPVQVAESDAGEAAHDIPAGLGAEQVVARQERETKEGRENRKTRIKAEAFEARIVDFARTAAGRLIIVLDNGQVWAQRLGDSQDVRLRDGDKPDVTIRRGALSGYRMELSDPNVTIVVERLK
jgi:hypothetical protein